MESLERTCEGFTRAITSNESCVFGLAKEKIVLVRKALEFTTQAPPPNYTESMYALSSASVN